MTKEEVIKEAYGEYWEENIRPVDGFLRYGGRQADKENDFWECKQWLGYFLYRPASLDGIENNNGWIKIESEDDLPNEYKYYYIKAKGCEFIAYNVVGKRIFIDEIGSNIEYKYITHYQPIIKPQPPIY